MGEWQVIINAGATAVLGAIGWFLKGIKDDMRALETRLAAFRTEVAERYATRPDLQRIDDKLDRILERLPPKP